MDSFDCLRLLCIIKKNTKIVRGYFGLLNLASFLIKKKLKKKIINMKKYEYQDNKYYLSDKKVNKYIDQAKIDLYQKLNKEYPIIWGRMHNVYCILGSSFYNKNQKLYEVIVSSCFLPINVGINQLRGQNQDEDVLESILSRFNALNIHKILLIMIYPNSNNIDLQFEKHICEYSNRSKYPHITFDVQNINYKDFFTKENLNSLILPKNDTKYDYKICLFFATNWSYLLSDFRLFNIVISGGSNTKRHMLSPLQNKLSKFIACYEENSDALVSDSFHFDRLPSNKTTHSLIDFKSKKSNFLEIIEQEKKDRLNEDRTQLMKSFTPFVEDLEKIDRSEDIDVKNINFINDSSSALLDYINSSHHKNNADKLENVAGDYPSKRYFPSSTEVETEVAKIIEDKHSFTDIDLSIKHLFEKRAKEIHDKVIRINGLRFGQRRKYHFLNRSSDLTLSPIKASIEIPDTPVLSPVKSDFVSNNIKYSSQSIFYNELLKTLLKGPINEETQISIEKYLLNQYLEVFLKRTNSNRDLNFKFLTYSLFFFYF